MVAHMITLTYTPASPSSAIETKEQRSRPQDFAFCNDGNTNYSLIILTSPTPPFPASLAVMLPFVLLFSLSHWCLLLFTDVEHNYN